MEAKVLPLRRPFVVIFERFDVEDMAAMFRAKRGGDTYHFTLLPDGSLEEAFIRRNNEEIVPSDDFNDDEKDYATRLIRHAYDVHREQLAIWNTLGTSERLALLIQWGQEVINDLTLAIQSAASEDAKENAEEIALLCKDIETHEAYLAGLEAALSLL